MAPGLTLGVEARRIFLNLDPQNGKRMRRLRDKLQHTIRHSLLPITALQLDGHAVTSFEKNKQNN